MDRRRLRLVLVVGWFVTLLIPFAPTAMAEERLPLAEFSALPAQPQVTPAARAAREKFLGDRWDDPRFVTLHWTGVSSFVVTIGGHLLLFDAWEIIGAVDGYLPITREDLAALDPEAILVGHGHFDHAGDLGYVAGRTGAVVVGSEEICDVASAGAEREGVGSDFRCAITGTATSPPMGTVQQFRLFADLPPVSVLQHIHSASRPPGNGNELDPYAPIMDPQPYLEHFNDDPEELARFLGQQEESDQGGTWMYHLVDGDFTLLLGDSAGPIFDQPMIRRALASFPGCVDVMANAILGFDQPVSGLQDPVMYVDSVRPAVFLPTHADAWAPVISAGQEQYRAQLTQELDALRYPPKLDFVVDPRDYVRQRAYRVSDPRWRLPPPGSACGKTAGSPKPGAADVPDTLSSAKGSGSLPATGLPAVVALTAAASLGVAILGWRRRGT